MAIIDYLIFALYMIGVLAIGYYHFRRNKNAEDYYVGSRSIKSHHVGLSIVATDVGGGFSIGLGGLGYAMGLSGSWLLFTGLVGAWLAAVLIIPQVKAVDKKHGMYTYPDFLRFRYNGRVALVAALISGIGYLGFTGGQILAGAKLASATIFNKIPLNVDPFYFSIHRHRRIKGRYLHGLGPVDHSPHRTSRYDPYSDYEDGGTFNAGQQAPGKSLFPDQPQNSHLHQLDGDHHPHLDCRHDSIPEDVRL